MFTSSTTNFLNGFSGDYNVEECIKKMRQKTSDSFFLCNLSDLIRKFDDWVKKMPRVNPHYAVKCNDNIEVLKTFASIGCSFDCASAGEISKILSLNVSPERIIFASTTKILKHIVFAQENKVNLMTFDNEDEVRKIAKVHPKSNLVLRIRYSSEKAKYNLGKKFGCDPLTEAPKLLKLAKIFNLNVVGISFHIGSSCEDYDVYCEAIKVSRHIFKLGTDIGFNFDFLDLGGGFPGNNFQRIDEFSGMINKALDENFPLEEFPTLKVISEPGRYFVESAFTLVASIHSRKVTRYENGSVQDVMYYLNEGVFSNFLYHILGPEAIEPHIMRENRSCTKFKSIIWGPTGDSTDVLCPDIELELLRIGDVLYFANMGAYTIPCCTTFNGFEKTKVYSFINFDDCVRLNLKLFDLSSSDGCVINE